MKNRIHCSVSLSYNMSVDDVADIIHDFLAGVVYYGVYLPCDNSGDGVVLIRDFHRVMLANAPEIQFLDYKTCVLQPLMSRFQKEGWRATLREPDYHDLKITCNSSSPSL